MGDVINLNKEVPTTGPKAVAEIIAWLRKQADAIESGEHAPVIKAILVTYEDRGDEYRVSTAYCNALTVERSGMLATALHDTVDVK